MFALVKLDVGLRDLARLAERMNATLRQHFAMFAHALPRGFRADLVLAAIGCVVGTARILDSLAHRESTTGRQNKRHRRKIASLCIFDLPSKLFPRGNANDVTLFRGQ